MKLFVLEHTPLADAAALTTAPAAGDVVAYLRATQDPTGAGTQALEAAGVRVVYGEGLISNDESQEMDRFSRKFFDDWYIDGDTDITAIGALSFGDMATNSIANYNNPTLLVRTGEIVRRLLAAEASADTLVTDLINGRGVENVYNNKLIPQRDVAAAVAAHMNRRFATVDPVNPLPPRFNIHPPSWFMCWARSLVGSLRPRYLKARFFRKPADKPVVFSVYGRALQYVFKRLAGDGRFCMVSDLPSVAGADVFRIDHMLATPSLAEICKAWDVYRHAKSMEHSLANSDAFVWGGINYGPFFARGTARMLRLYLPSVLIGFAQTRKALQKMKPAAIITNGESGIVTKSLHALSRGTERKIFFIRHGMNCHPRTIRCMSHNNSHVTYIACGEEHRAEYGRKLADADKPNRPVLGSPLTTAMNDVKGRRSKVHGLRVLLTSQAFSRYDISRRVRGHERYKVDVFDVARRLADDGWTINYRLHPGATHDLTPELRLAEEMGVADIINWDTQPTYGDALLDNDVVVASLSSSHYQALYAGWPTVFYDPGFDVRDFLGAPASPVAPCPVASDPEELYQAIVSSTDPESEISTYPKAFATTHAMRFIGPAPERADEIIADYLIGEMTAKEA